MKVTHTSMTRPLRLGLAGWPLEHSRSPNIHNAAIKACKLEGEYRLYPVPLSDGSREGLESLLAGMRRGDLHGLNVTIPYKETVISLLDDLSPAARMIGAVNTVVCMDGRLLGENTDSPGFAKDLDKRGFALDRLQGGQALVLGSGGAARAVVYALVSAGWQVTVSALYMEQGETLAADLGESQVKVIPFPVKRETLENRPALIVNATPLGMSPQLEENPWPEGVPFPAGAFIYDLVYNPVETTLVKSARAAGLRAFTGTGMLVEQAALSWELWTGIPAPRQAMRQAASFETEAE